MTAEAIPGEFTFDCDFTNASILNHIHRHKHTYAGDLKANRVIVISGQGMALSAWVKTRTTLVPPLGAEA